MTPKEKAKELVAKFRGFEMPNEKLASVQCAMYVVDEILDFMVLNLGWKENGNGNVDFWMEVKNEMQSL